MTSKNMRNFTLVFTLLCMCSGIATAANKTLERDETQRVFERKAQLQLRDMGMKGRNASLPVVFCPDKKDCLPLGKWTFRVSENVEAKAAPILMTRLSGSRYDTISVAPNKLVLKTLSETLETESNIPTFNFETGSFQSFQSATEKYLADNIAPLMSNILAKAKDARYQEMPDREKETFLATIAKEQSVPVKFIQRLMNSAFAFSVYIERPRGSVKIKEIPKKKKLLYEADVSVSLSMQLLIHRYNADTEKFEFYKVISGGSGSVSDSAVVFPAKPGIEKVRKLFDNSFIVAAKAAGISTNLTLIEDDNFSIFAIVNEVDAPSFKSSVGANEDLRVDAPYKVFRFVDGKNTEIGWGKARKVASRKTYREEPGNYASDFDLIRGEIEISDQVREHPWSGFLWFIDGASANHNVDRVGPENNKLVDEGTGVFYGPSIGIKSDLGFLFNSPGFSEKWFEMWFSAGFGGEDLMLNGQSEYESDYLLSVGFDIVHRTHVGSTGLYMGFKYGLGVTHLSASPANTITSTDEDNLKITSYGIDFGFQTGFTKSPNFEIFANIGTFLPIAAEAKIGDTNYEAKTTNEIDFDSLGFEDLNITIGFAWHRKQVGGLARMMN